MIARTKKAKKGKKQVLLAGACQLVRGRLKKDKKVSGPIYMANTMRSAFQGPPTRGLKPDNLP